MNSIEVSECKLREKKKCSQNMLYSIRNINKHCPSAAPCSVVSLTLKPLQTTPNIVSTGDYVKSRGNTKDKTQI